MGQQGGKDLGMKNRKKRRGYDKRKFQSVWKEKSRAVDSIWRMSLVMIAESPIAKKRTKTRGRVTVINRQGRWTGDYIKGKSRGELAEGNELTILPCR